MHSVPGGALLALTCARVPEERGAEALTEQGCKSAVLDSVIRLHRKGSGPENVRDFLAIELSDPV
jgi:hypothetical protein